MIAKKVSKKSSSKAKGISDLITYIFEKPDSPEERLIYSGSRNFISEEINSQRCEMIGLALSEKRSPQPVCHWILSWKEFENPSFEQIEEAVDVFLKELGLDQNQTLFAIHGDTENKHVHLIINRVHSELGKVITPNKGFDKIAGQKAIARIEKMQGWDPEKGSLYRVNENGDIEKNSDKKDLNKTPHEQETESFYADPEGIISSAKKMAFKIFSESKTWAEFQTQLADCGIEFQQKGSGAVFVINGVQIKASKMDRRMAFKELLKKWGNYEKQSVEIKEFKSLTKEEKNRNWLSYTIAKKSFHQDKKELLQKLYGDYKKQLAELKINQKKERIEKLSKTKNKSKSDFITLKSLMAKNHLEEKLTLKDRYNFEKEVIQNKYHEFPSYRRWQIQRGVLHELSGDQIINKKTPSEGIRGFDTKTSGDKVFYFKNREGQPDVKFIDFGRRIEVRSHSERESLLSAMQLAQQKWGRVKLTGSEEFINTCLSLAVENGFIISNQELKLKFIKLRDGKMNFKKNNIEKLKSDFEKYNAALGAESYHVTAQTVDKFGDKKTWVLDRENGKSLGYKADVVLDKIELMNNLNSKGENIYLTPLSEKYYFILVDDLSKVNLERFLKDGFKPCVVLESSPENFQAILKIPKNETENEIGNTLIRNLNQTYGDPNLAGVVHPHRAPGFYNQKEKYKINNELPSVNLVYVESINCEKSLSLFEEIKKEILQKENENKIRIKNEKKDRFKSIDPATAYRAHIENIADSLLKKNDQQPLDWSRLDWMAAQRMRITGFEKDQIFSAICENGKNLREQFGSGTNRSARDFELYAVKTATQIFSERSKAEIEKLAKYKDYFLNVEGRSKIKEKSIDIERSHK